MEEVMWTDLEIIGSRQLICNGFTRPAIVLLCYGFCFALFRWQYSRSWSLFSDYRNVYIVICPEACLAQKATLSNILNCLHPWHTCLLGQFHDYGRQPVQLPVGVSSDILNIISRPRSGFATNTLNMTNNYLYTLPCKLVFSGWKPMR